MAYYSGSASSLNDLLNAVVAACTANGWTWADGILSKGAIFIKPTVSTVAPVGLLLQGGTGKNVATLLNPSPGAVRLGPAGTGTTIYGAITWPAQYHIHVNADPDECYVVLNTNISDFYWAAFGKSTIPLSGTGLWMTANAPQTTTGNTGISISETSGTNTSGYWCPAAFWAAMGTNLSATARAAFVQSAAGGTWPIYQSDGVKTLDPLMARQPNSWNGEAVMLPIREWMVGPENKRQLLLDTAHARYVRLHNLEPFQVITLGADRWRVYPFYRKNASSPGGTSGSGGNHTGTFGWALREGSA